MLADREYEIDYDEQDDGVQLYLYEKGEQVGGAMFCPVDADSLGRAALVGKGWGTNRTTMH